MIELKKLGATLLVAFIAISGCGSEKSQEQQVTACVRRNGNVEEAVALDLCRDAQNTGSTASDFFWVYMLMSVSRGYAYPLGPFTPYGRYQYVSPADTSAISRYGGVQPTATKPPKTTPLREKSTPKAPISKPKSYEPPKSSVVPKSDGIKLPEPAKPKPKTPTPKPKINTPRKK